MYLCICMCTCVYIHTYAYTHTQACWNPRGRIRGRAFPYQAFWSVHTYAYTYIHVHRHVCRRAGIRVIGFEVEPFSIKHSDLYIHIHIHTYMHTSAHSGVPESALWVSRSSLSVSSTHTWIRSSGTRCVLWMCVCVYVLCIVRAALQAVYFEHMCMHMCMHTHM